MKSSNNLFVICLLALLSIHAHMSYAQSTDGTHSTQILPIAVDTASFKSRITITSSVISGSSTSNTVVDAIYVPADGTPQASGPYNCKTTWLPAGASVTYPSLTDLCPGLAAGNNFGYVRFRRIEWRPFPPAPSNSTIGRGFAVFSRVSNPNGNGFSVEAYPESAFADQPQVVHGLRKLAATANSPAYQTNCFVSTFGVFPSNNSIRIDISNNFMQQPLASLTVTPGPYRMYRLLDIFNAAGLSADQDEMAITATQIGSTTNGAFVFFCTVQDNTSFGADFRIGEPFSIAVQRNNHRLRRSVQNIDDLARQFVLPPSSHQVYFLNFQNPDLVGCEITNPNGSALISNPGLEIYMRRTNDTLSGEGIPGAGGANSLLFSNISTASSKASNLIRTGYLLIVQSTATAPNTPINYGVVCRSGSGHSKLQRVYAGSGRLIP